MNDRKFRWEIIIGAIIIAIAIYYGLDNLGTIISHISFPTKVDIAL